MTTLVRSTETVSFPVEWIRLALERVRAHGNLVAADLVDAIPRTALGKASLIRRAQLAAAAH